MSDKSAEVLENKKPFARYLNQLVVLSLALLMVAQSIGCSSVSSLGFGEAITIGYRDFVWAKRAFNLRYGNCQRPYAEHFESGFCAGYIDTCNGGDGFVPALPPSDYRGAQFQSVDGAQCVNSWFEGYPAGVAAAKQDKAGDFHDVMISRLVDSAIKQEKTKHLLPQDIPIVNSRNEAAKKTAAKKTAAQQAAARRSLPPIEQPTVAPSIPTPQPTRLPPIISREALSISPTQKTSEPIHAELPQIVPASYGAVKSNTPLPTSYGAVKSNTPLPTSYGAVKPNTPLPAAISHKPWSSSRN